MAEQRRVLDVWIIETNTVYRDVPFTVVVDWVQQGRLLADDRLRPAGTGNWAPLATQPEFAAYLPHPEPHRAEDQAEALEPVQVDFAWKRGTADEDEDVDMIPLIDVSLVLLVFFMMTATITVAGLNVDVPPIDSPALLVTDTYWIGIQRKPDGRASYSVGSDKTGNAGSELTEDQAIARLEGLLKDVESGVDLRISADRGLANGLVMATAEKVELLKQKQKKLRNIYSEVREKGQ